MEERNWLEAAGVRGVTVSETKMARCWLPRWKSGRDVLPVPLDSLTQSVAETNFGCISQVLPGPGDIGLRMLDVPRPWFHVNWRNVLAGDFVDLLKHRIDGDAIAAGDVERLSPHAGGRA